MEFSLEKCPICYEPFNSYKKPYILLICGHTFCSPCINQIKKECNEDTEKYITLKEYYNKQKKQSDLCDSEVSLFSDNCQKKSSISSLSSVNNEKDKENENLSKEGDSYDEVEEKEEKNENWEEDKEEAKSEKSNSFGEDNNFEEDEEESEEKNDDEEEESSDESDENDDNSEKSFNNINDIIAINENNSKNEKKIKKIFKFKCPFCSVRIKITDKELIINENVLKINEIANNENHINNNENINNKNKYFCELCNNVVDKHNHYEKFGIEHDNHLFELNKNLFERAFINLNQFISSQDDIILKAKEFLNDFNQSISENQELISKSKQNFINYCKYNSKFISVLKKTKQKVEKLSDNLKNKQEDNNLDIKEETKLLENIKSFNQLINGIFFFPQLKMKLISEKDSDPKSNLYFEYSLKETYNQYLENGFFHFLRNKLFKSESKYIPFFCTLTKRNFLYNSELNVLIKIKVPKNYSNSFYESSSDGSVIYGFSQKKNSKSSEFFSFDIHSKKIKFLPSIPLADYKKLDTIIYNDIKLFVIGGLGKYHTPITSCFCYNIINNKWEKMPKLKYNRYNKALYIYRKDLIVFGGKCEAKDSSYIFEKIDLTILKNWESFTIKNFSANIYNFGYCAYTQDIIFIVGGEDQVTEDFVKKGYAINLKEKSVIEEFNINDVLENNVHTPKCYRGVILSIDKELYNLDILNIWKRLHKLNMNLP